MRNPAPDSSLCRAAPRLRPLQLLLAAYVASAAARRLRRFSCCSRARLRHPLQLLLPVCLRFQLLLPVCLRFQLLLPDCARFSCCSPLAFASAAAPDRVLAATPRLRPLQLLLPDCACWIPAHAMPGVIKFWGPHENGDPGSPFSLVKWGPLWENGDPHTVFVLRCIK